jgi:GT2 family glycosyltransferase
VVFAAFDRGVRVSLGVVTLGTPDRLRGCLEALRTHESRHDFTVAVVVNSDTPDGAPGEVDAPTGVMVDQSRVNLGWAGGLHRARALTDAELLVWVQDDMAPEPGWLDALVDAADARPEVGVLGSVRVDALGAVVKYNAGSATPYDAVELWNDTDSTATDLPADVAAYDWVASRGLLTRAAVFDEVSGPDPRLWPLNHVDKEYCTHVRAHGWDVALVPGARLTHGGGVSAPAPFRAFLARWGEPSLNQRLAPTVAALAGQSSARVAHRCAEWRGPGPDPVAAAVGTEASRMLVPLARWHASHDADLEARALHFEHHHGLADQARATAEAERDRARHRVRRLRRRLREQERSLSWRITRPLRGLRRRR